MQTDSRLQNSRFFSTQNRFFKIFPWSTQDSHAHLYVHEHVPITVSLFYLLVKEQDEQLKQESFNNNIHWIWNKVQAAQ